MTELIRRISHRPRALLLPLALIVLAAVAGLALRAAARPEARTVTLVARDMAFYVAGDPTPNPRLLASPGESLRLELRNEETGMTHDLSLPELERATRPLSAPGESAALELRAPSRPGEYEYVCTMHTRMMRGILEVR